MATKSNPRVTLNKETAINLYNQGLPIADICNKMGLSLANTQNLIYRARAAGLVGYREKLRKIATEPYWDNYPKIKSDNCMVWGDPHSSTLHPKFASFMVDMALKFKCNTLAVIGDFFNQKCFSQWGDASGKFETELHAMEKFCEILTNMFDRIYILRGNHDEWVLKLVNNKIEFATIMKLVTQNKRVIVSELPAAILNNNWFLCHPKEYSRISGRVANNIANVNLMNVVTAHGHCSSLSFHASGQFQLVDIGGLTDRHKHEYIGRRITSHPKWVKGFVIIKNNIPYLFTEHTDEKFWLNNITIKA